MLIRTLAAVFTATALIIVLALVLSGQALADDDDYKHGHGHGGWYGRDYHAYESHRHGHGEYRGRHRRQAYRDSHWQHAYRDRHWQRAYRRGHRPDRYAPVDIAWLFGPVFSELLPGQALVWQDPDYGDRYQVVPTREYQTAQGRYCREYQATAIIGGRPQATYGTACLQPDGSWEIVQ